MTRIITITNQKGGVGKTTTAIHLAHGLALAGKRVLLVDLDAQAQAGIAMHIPPADGAFFLLTMGLDRGATEYIRAQMKEVRPGWRLLPASKRLAGVEPALPSPAVSWLAETLKRFERDFDYIVLDTAPTVNRLQVLAMWAADWVIVPAAPEPLSANSIQKVVQTLTGLKKQHHWQGGLFGTLPTMYRERVREHAETLADYRHRFGEALVLPPIHLAARLAESPAYGQTVFERSPTDRAAREYSALVQAVLKAR